MALLVRACEANARPSQNPVAMAKDLLPRWLPDPSPWKLETRHQRDKMRKRMNGMLEENAWVPKSHASAINNPAEGRRIRLEAEDRQVQRLSKELREFLGKRKYARTVEHKAILRVLHYGYDRTTLPTEKAMVNVQKFMHKLGCLRGPDARRAFNTIIVAMAGPVGSDTHVPRQTIDRCLRISQYTDNWDERVKMGTQVDLGKIPTFDNPKAKYEFRRHHATNILLCENWYHIFMIV